jgi:hypothetical protein
MYTLVVIAARCVNGCKMSGHEINFICFTVFLSEVHYVTILIAHRCLADITKSCKE